MLSEVRHQEGATGDWKQRLRVVMRSYREACLRHPAVATISSSSPNTEVAFIHFEQDLATMEEAGFSPQEAALTLRSLLAFTSGMINSEIQPILRRQAGKVMDSGPDREVVHRYPHLEAAYEHFMNQDRTAAFEFGLERLLTGIEREREPYSGK